MQPISITADDMVVIITTTTIVAVVMMVVAIDKVHHIIDTHQLITDTIKIMPMDVSNNFSISMILYLCFVYLDKRVTCAKLADPANGAVKSSGYYLHDTAVHSCNSGYRLRGNRVRKCQSNGKWSGSAPTCERKLIS